MRKGQFMNNSECRFCHSNNVVLVDSLKAVDINNIYLCEVCLSVLRVNVEHGAESDFDSERSKRYVELETQKLSLNNASLVMHIGSGDGSLLKLFKSKSIPCFGFEPNQQLANIAQERNVKTLPTDFGIEQAWELLSGSNEITNGNKIDLIVANAIIDKGLETQEVLEAIRLVLKENGSITFLENSLLAFNKHSTDSSETFISTLSLSKELEKHDLEIVDLETLDGTPKVIWTARPKGLFPVSPFVVQYVGQEQINGLDSLDGVIEYLTADRM